MISDLSELQRDALIEIFNIGVGRAASSMSQIVGEPIALSVPTIEMLYGDHRAGAISRLVPSMRICAVSQDFIGSLNARAFLIFPEGRTHEIVRRMLGDTVSTGELGEMEQEALSEIGNIILNSCMSSLSDALQASFQCTSPACHMGPTGEALSISEMQDEDLLMLCHIDFSMPKAQIDGYLVFLLSVHSFNELIKQVDRFLSGIIGQS